MSFVQFTLIGESAWVNFFLQRRMFVEVFSLVSTPSAFDLKRYIRKHVAQKTSVDLSTTFHQCVEI